MAGLLAAVGVAVAGLGAAPAEARQAGGLKHELRKLVHEGVPGVTLLVRDGERTSIMSAGRAALSPDTPMRGGQRFRIGSITKPMVAAVVLQLAEEGRLSLDQPHTDFVGDLAGGDERITVRNLLAHRSGINEYTEDPRAFKPYLAGHFDHVWTPQQLIGFAVDREPAFAPDADVAYSNTNYVLLALIVEKVTGSSLGAQLRTRVFEPLHMDDTSLAIKPGIRGPHVHGYLVGQGSEPLDVTGVSPSVYWGAGNVTSTPRDVADFIDGLLGGKLLSPAMFAAMSRFEPMYPDYDYGLGLGRSALPCGDGIGHDGAVAGYLSTALQMEDGRTVVAVANSITLDDRVGTKKAAAQYRRLFIRAACGPVG